MPFFGVRPPPLLCSRRPHRTFVPLSPSCRAIVQVETRSKRSWFSMPSLASDRRRRCALAVPIGRSYRSRHRARRDRSRRDALVVSSWFSMPSLASDPAVAALSPSTICLYRSRHRAGRLFKSRRALIAFAVLNALLWRQDAAAAVLSPSTPDVCTALAIMQGDRSSRDALKALMVLDALFGVGPPPRCALAVPIGRLYRFCHRARRSRRLYKSRRAWYSMPFFSVKPPPLLCSRRPHRTFIPLSPSCRAIVRVDARSLCAHRLNALSNIGRDEALYGAGSALTFASDVWRYSDGLLPS